MINKIIKIFLFFLISFTLVSCGFGKEVSTLPPFPNIEVTEIPNEFSFEIENAEEPVKINYNEYNISLDINYETNMVKGVENVMFYNGTGEELNSIYFNMPLNAFSKEAEYQPYFSEHKEKIFYGDKDYGYIDVSKVRIEGEEAYFTTELTALQVNLSEKLPPGKKIEITLQFEAYIPKINHRTGSNKNALWLGNFIPTVAVYNRGEFRINPYYKVGESFYAETANYKVSVSASPKYKVIAPGTSSVKEENNVRITTFTAKVIRDFSIVLLDSTYTQKEIVTKDDVKITLYYRSNLKNPEEILNTAKSAMEFYNSYIGSSYFYEKFDIVETGLFMPCGMEYSQMTFVDEAHLNSSGAQRTVAHEIAHQWFYNMVGNDPVKDPWMDEALASFMSDKFYGQNEENLHRRLEAEYKSLQESDASLYKLSDDLSVYKSWEEYYNTQYLKGKLMIYSLYLKMGDEKFKTFINLYYSKYSYKIASPKDFISSAEEVYGRSLSLFFESWMDADTLPALSD